jgi:hypothetical protein
MHAGQTAVARFGDALEVTCSVQNAVPAVAAVRG